MAKDFFSVSACKSFSSLKAGDPVHFIGVSGVAMGQLAVALAEAGFRVSGSDIRYYEPMGSFLKSSSVSLCEGYDAKNIPAGVKLVVIGNAISYGNPEVDQVEEENLPYTFLPKLIGEFLIEEAHSIVIAGTHGKTTTTCLSAHLLSTLGENPSYFIGGVVEGFQRSLHKGAGKYCVLEGDEYDSAFFAKLPKFHFYRPKTLVINALEYDHADIYPNVEAIAEEFRKLAESVPADGHILACIDFPLVKKLIDEHRQEFKAKVFSFGDSANADYQITNRKVGLAGQNFTLFNKNTGELHLSIPHQGIYNARNASAAAVIGITLAYDKNAIASALSSSPRPKRRQEVLFDNGNITLIEDFAHHPTAVEQTLATIREIYPSRKIIALFEPRSAASRRKVFQEEYRKAFLTADCALLSEVAHNAYDEGQELLHVPELAREIRAGGTPSEAYQKVDDIFEGTTKEIQDDSVMVVMSNGSFDGIAARLKAHCRASYPMGNI